MLPRFEDGRVLVASGWFRSLRPSDVIIVHHDGREKIKRIHQVEGDQLYVVGDNPAESTDSRDFGWLSQELVAAKVIWPRA
jgi:phage repressor protein C with HTH and peptisase S24 domain